MGRISAAVMAALLVITVPSSVWAGDTIRFEEFYSFSVLGTKFTPKLVSLVGKQVSVIGFMAPPLRASGDFFVLTRQPVSLCPFCNSDADWPADIMVVYLAKEEFFTPHGRPLLVSGTLQVGSFTDPDTGFVSQLRLVNAHYTEQ